MCARGGLERNENIKKLEELVHFLQESMGVCILFEFANDFELFNLLEVLHLLKFMASATQI
jgi:hypothetical protein